MAYSFVPPGGGSFGGTLGGYGSLGIGAGLMNAMGSGLNLAQAFRRYQNDNMLDQYRIPAQEAEANNAMWNNDFGALRASAAENQIMPYLRTGAQPGPILDQNGNLVSQPVANGANQQGMPYAGTQPFMGTVYNNQVNGQPPAGVSQPAPVLSNYLTTPPNSQQNTVDPRYMLNGY
jgi:hypothetical protein